MNFVDYHVLRRLCGIVSRGMAVREEFLFDPPAGSKLVAEVINDIKKTYSFIDLLKPEVEAAFPVILALEPGRRRELLKIAKALAEGKARRKQQLRRYDSNITARADLPAPTQAGVPVRDEFGGDLGSDGWPGGFRDAWRGSWRDEYGAGDLPA
jgi:hypothetical protein